MLPRCGFSLKYNPPSLPPYLPCCKHEHGTDNIQVLWLHQGFRLEFLGLSSFVPGLFLSSLFFFAVNCWILGILVQDIGGLSSGLSSGSVAAK